MRRHFLAGLAALPVAKRWQNRPEHRAVAHRLYTDESGTSHLPYRAVLLPPSKVDYAEAARTVWGEARGMSLGGQMAVVHTLCNRVVSPHGVFMNATSLAVAALQPDQFRPETPPACMSEWLDRVVRQAVALHQAGFDVTDGAEFFARANCRPSWRRSVREVARFDGQVFYRLVSA